MQSETWQRLEAVFFGALELPEEQRGEFLDRACAGDPELRAEVEAVLSAHDRGDELASEVDQLLSGGDPPAPDEMIGVRLGPYRIEERIGRGGMGDVYRAQRVDDQYRQEVAIKVMRSGLTAEMLRRFALERQILARLVHPHIAPLFDGGVTGRGHPYLVMQYVQGVPVTQYTTARGLSVPERLALFATVCEAVQFAHQNLVVHRDLKPSNILVTPSGDVKLLDFGIAKLLDPEWMDLTAPVTELVRPLTPAHAAPEQIAGGTITTATDVYGLGVLLYELLTGTRPFEATTTMELQRAVCEQQPERPSVRASSVHASQVPADLDHIVLMALRKEPERRYASAGQLGEDVSRFLDGRPIIARNDTLRYRVSKFVRRNRLAVSLSAAAIMCLLAGLVGTAWQARRASIEAEQANDERDRARLALDLLVDMFRLSDPKAVRGRSIPARDTLDRGAGRVLRDFADQPALQADLLVDIGQIYENLGLFDDASVHLERAVELRRDLFGERDVRVAETLSRLARVRTGQERAEDAVALARDAVVALRNARLPEPKMLARSLVTLGAALRLAGSPAAASAAYEEAVAILENEETLDDTLLAEAFFGWAAVAHSQHRFDEAEALLQETVDRYRRLDGGPHPELATSLHDLGMIRMFRSKPSESIPLLQQAVEIRRRIFTSDHAAVAESLTGLMQVLSLEGRYDEALEVGDEALTIADAVWGADSLSAAEMRQGLGFVLLQSGRGERAMRALEEARAVFEREGRDATRRITSGILIGQAYASMGKFEQARAQFADTLEQCAEILSPRHRLRAPLLLEMARLDVDHGDLERAEAEARESLASTTETERSNHRFALWANVVLARVAAARGELDRARNLLRDVLRVQVCDRGQEHYETAATLVALADVENRLGHHDEAEAHARTAVAALAGTGPARPDLAEAHSVLGAALGAQGRWDEARPLLQDAVNALSRARGARPRQVREARARLRELPRRRP